MAFASACVTVEGKATLSKRTRTPTHTHTHLTVSIQNATKTYYLYNICIGLNNIIYNDFWLSQLLRHSVRNHKYPVIMPQVVLFTTTSGLGTCTSTRARCCRKQYYLGHCVRVLVLSVNVQDKESVSEVSANNISLGTSSRQAPFVVGIESFEDKNYNM